MKPSPPPIKWVHTLIAPAWNAQAIRKYDKATSEVCLAERILLASSGTMFKGADMTKVQKADENIVERRQ
jgi:hypothetical protein